jgi:hypothetical protein
MRRHLGASLVEEGAASLPRLRPEEQHTSVRRETAALRDFNRDYVCLGSTPEALRRNRNGRFTSISGHPEMHVHARTAACLHTLRPTRVDIEALSALGSFEGGSAAPSKAP